MTGSGVRRESGAIHAVEVVNPEAFSVGRQLAAGRLLDAAVAPMTATSTARAISVLTGEFVSAADEESFRRRTWTTWVRQVRFVCLAGAAFYLAGFVVDALLVGPSLRLWVLLATRLVAASGAVLTVLVATRTPDRIHALDRSVLALLLVAALATCFIIALSPGGVIIHAFTVFVIVLVYYLYIPNRTAFTVASGVFLGVAFIVTAAAVLRPKPNELALVILYLLLANVVGSYVTRLVQRSRRQEYAILEAERAGHESLRREIEGRRAAEGALAESEERYRSLVELSPDAIVVHQGMRIVYLNPAAATMMGFEDPHAVHGASVLDFIEPVDHAATLDRMERLASSGEALPAGEIRVRSPHGRLYECEVVSGPITFRGEAAVHSVLRDITDRKRMEDELRRLASTDSLTGARSRHFFFEQGAAEWQRALRHHRPLSVLMLDIDHFKMANDTYGHAAGDEVLKALVHECTQLLRAEDLVGRLGGEEFAVLLPEVDLEAARAVAERLRERFAALEVQTPGGALSCTVSIGAATRRPEDESLEMCLRRADDALYAAKKAGRNRVVAA